jgi:hypothetical protein
LPFKEVLQNIRDLIPSHNKHWVLLLYNKTIESNRIMSQLVYYSNHTIFCSLTDHHQVCINNKYITLLFNYMIKIDPFFIVFKLKISILAVNI